MDTENLKKIDWAKFKKRSWRDVELVPRLAGYDNSIVRLVPAESLVSTAVARKKPEGWEYTVSNATTADIDLLRVICSDVDFFIATELARLEAEEEDNWVAIHWRDADWLASLNASVQSLDEEIREWVKFPYQFNATGRSACSYRADKRTFPAGYDPEEPRWVKIENSDVCRLYNAGYSMAIRGNTYGDDWRPVFSPNGSNKYEYAIDIHTLPPGVPLHVETKPATVPGSHSPHYEFTVDLGESPSLHVLTNGKTFTGHALDSFICKRVKIQVDMADDKPKSEPRPCSKAFALKHPDESECRNFGDGFDSGWRHISRFSFDAPIANYEFRTTAKAEVKPRVVAEIPAEFAVSGVTIHFENSDLLARGLCLAKEGKNPRIALIVDEEG